MPPAALPFTLRLRHYLNGECYGPGLLEEYCQKHRMYPPCSGCDPSAARAWRPKLVIETADARRFLLSSRDIVFLNRHPRFLNGRAVPDQLIAQDQHLHGLFTAWAVKLARREGTRRQRNLGDDIVHRVVALRWGLKPESVKDIWREMKRALPNAAR